MFSRQQIFPDAGAYLEITLVSLVNLFNPSIDVIGGGISQLGDLLLDQIRKRLMGKNLNSTEKVIRIKLAVLGRSSSSIGAVM